MKPQNGKATVYDNGAKQRFLAKIWKVPGIFCFWPFDFTGICNSEIVALKIWPQNLKALGVKLIGASCDTFFSHQKWFASDDFETPPSFPVIADHKHKVSKRF